MTPNDPRHGTYAGYIGGCRCDDCGLANYRTTKRLRHERAQGIRMWHSADEVRAVIAPWLGQGFTLSAIGIAAGLEPRGCARHLGALLTDGGRVRRGTYRQLVAITEDDFADKAKIPADLTRKRIHSLMAAGHKLCDLPILGTGQWRTREHVTVEFARTVRTTFRDLEMVPGTSARTARYARKRGHVPPLAWDDPGTLAWDHSNTPSVIEDDHGEDIDHTVIERILAGDVVPSTRPEREEVVRRWSESGWPMAELERLTGWKVARYSNRKDVA